MTLTAESLAQAMGGTLSIDRYRSLLPAMNDAMIAAGVTNANRAAAWCSQIGHESVGLKYMAEIETSNPAWSADRTRYRGRGPIQLTWEGNYRKFGQWCSANGYVTDAELFVKQPELVEQPKWGFLAASWYWLNAGPRPGQINGFADRRDILAVSRCINGWVDGKQPNGMPDRQARWDRCLAMGDAIIPDQDGVVTVPDNRPDFNEFAIWSANNSARSAKVDCFLLHTQEGGGGDAAAENLAKWFENDNGVSYHYTVSQAADGGVTVVDCVDTDFASWSVLSANSRSINLCFAGSRAGWSRADWLKQSKAIDVAAYLAVQDAEKYDFATKVVAPPYTDRIPGISDHRYVTKVLGDGTHTDVGDNFPWDVFTAAVNKYATSTVTPPVVVPPTQPGNPRTDRQLLEEIWDQLRGPGGKGWPQLGGKSLVDGLAELLKKDAS